MNRPYHSTELSLVSRHCPYALELQERGVPADRSVYNVGIAAHAVLEEATRETNSKDRELTADELQHVALGVCSRLIATGRTYDGKPEGPMPADAAFAGKKVALDYLAWNPIQPGGEPERGIGLDERGNVVDYWEGDGLAIRTILDHGTCYTEADEESERTVLRVTDYKTAWSAGEDDLDTIQRKIQAVAAWKVYGPADVLILEIVNVRLGKSFTKRLYAVDGLSETLAEWWAEILTAAKALDAQKARGPRPAIPGRGCLGCPYLQACDHSQDYIERRGMHRTAEQRATAYCVAAAMRDELGEQLRIDSDEEPVRVEGGFVGTTAKVVQKVREDGYAILADRWEENGGDLHGFAKACELTGANAKNIAKALYFDRSAKADRDALLAEVLTEDRKREFGVWTEIETEAQTREETNHVPSV